MTTISPRATPSAEWLQEARRRHLWPHVTPLAAFADREMRIIERGEGAYVYDVSGRRYFDALSGLFTTQVGHGRSELAAAAARQAEKIAFQPVWGAAHRPAVELAERVSSLAPGDLNRIFFTTGGSEAAESAWKLARSYFAAIGQPRRYKVITRQGCYHGTTLGALSLTALPMFKAPFEPLVPGSVVAANTNFYRATEHRDDIRAFGAYCADSIEQAILREGPESVAAVFVEPVQNSGGCLPPPPGYLERVREICTRYGVLLVSDEVICAFGRLGAYFGAEKYGFAPDLITCAKGLTSGYSPLGALIVSDRIAEPFLNEGVLFPHGLTFAGHPVSCAVALANLDIFEREGIVDNVAEHEPMLREALESLYHHPIVGDVRGAGYLFGIEFVKDQASRERFTVDEADAIISRLDTGLADAGLLARADRRGDLVLTLAPPLICGSSEIEMIREVLDTVIGDVCRTA
ncbi:aspartate aminotransferase family protein [Nocardioides sp.]|uniref:aspartate aminotransferase family protein n=1 Tax=Nocardioides sp. TaxID=35761 RepID=UPI003D10E8C4